MNQHEQRMVHFLARREAYPHPITTIERRETHVSHVFLAGAFAYKLKKPVKFPFLDASTLALRKRFCLLELSLNRRLAPSVYLGMLPIVESGGRLHLGGKGRAVEWVVKMRRLPEDRMLDKLVAARQVSRRDMGHIAEQLVSFFRRAARSRRIDRFGMPEQVGRLALGNLQECAPFLGTLLSEADRQLIDASYRQFLTLREPLLVRRVREGRIIDGHGDLRCENICMTDPVTIFDCVEFEAAFRGGDIANDLSFLVMDLESRGRWDLADALTRRYRRAMHDATCDQVLAFYKCHRSLVRGKVRGFAWLQHPATAAGQRIRLLSRKHFQLARRYAQEFAKPRLVVVGGTIGTGKSTLAGGLAKRLGAVWLRTDAIRLAEFAGKRLTPQPFSGGIYAPHVSELVYQRLMHRAEALLKQGRSVVCDGTFSKASGRMMLRRIARRQGASFFFFQCTVPRTVALRRIAKRYATRSDISEARPEHYDRLKAGYEPVHGWPAVAWRRLSDNRRSDQTLAEALAILRAAWR